MQRNGSNCRDRARLDQFTLGHAPSTHPFGDALELHDGIQLREFGEERYATQVCSRVHSVRNEPHSRGTSWQSALCLHTGVQNGRICLTFLAVFIGVLEKRFRSYLDLLWAVWQPWQRNEAFDQC